MAQVPAAEANRNFSALFRRAQAGETILITDRGKPAVVLSPAGEGVGEEQAARRKAEIERRLRLWKELKAELDAQPPMKLGTYQREWGYE
jgi:prevent-host-death family protein